jgi:hypothetical protein
MADSYPDAKPETPGDQHQDADESIPLKIGDYVLLKSAKCHGVLQASGILDDVIRYNLEPTMYDEGVFQICYANQYSAARELQEFVEEQEAMVRPNSHC